VIFAAAVLLTRYVSLGSILATVAFPPLLWFIGPEVWRESIPAFAAVALGGVLIIYRHKDNIRRLLSGTENKFGKPKIPPNPTQVEKQA
jgi:glycerol-3-phosphate acyltransferase PlsY